MDVGVPLDRVASLLGHKSVDTTRTCTMPSEQDLQREVKKIALVYNVTLAMEIQLEHGWSEEQINLKDRSVVSRYAAGECTYIRLCIALKRDESDA